MNSADEENKVEKSARSLDVHLFDLFLLAAAQCGSIDKARTSLADGANVNVTDENGRTPLYHACQKGYHKLADFLLMNKANVYVGESPLIAAVRNNQMRCVVLLLRSGADMNVTSSDGETAFTLACKIGNVNLTECLFLHGVIKPSPCSVDFILQNCDLRLGMLKLLLHYGARNNLTYLIESLLKHFTYFGVNCKMYGKTALYHAAANGNVLMMKKLIDHGANMNKSNSGKLYCNASTPLHVACENGHYDAVEYLLRTGAIVDSVDGNGRTPLFYAAASRNTNILQLLLVKGAAINTRDEDGDNAMMFGYKTHGSNYVYVVNIFLNNIPHTTSDKHCRNLLVVAAKKGHYKIVELLLRFGIDPNHSNRLGDTALGGACVNSYEDIVKLLLEFNADPNFCPFDVQPHKFNSLALHSAARKGDISIVKLLLEHGANVNLTHSLPPSLNKWDRPPLLYALKNIYPKISHLHSIASIEDALGIRLNLVKMLLEMGADANICSYVDGYWKSALYIALAKLRISNIRKYIESLSHELNHPIFTGFRQVSSIDEGFKNFAETVLITRIKAVKLLVDHNLSLIHDFRPGFSEERSYNACDLENVLIPLENGCESVIYLFQAGADFKLLSWACGILKQDSSFQYDDRSVNLFKALVLNGLKVDSKGFQNLENSNQQSQKAKECFLEMSTWYQGQQQIPLSCMQLCRIKIRKQLLLATNSRSILKSIDKLGMPPCLEAYLKFEGNRNEFDLSTTGDRNWSEILNNIPH